MKAIQRENLYVSTIDPNAASLAKEYGLGLEIAEFCTAYYIDQHFPETNQAVLEKLEHVSKRIVHAPFNELFPCAIDPKARELAAYRYRQALKLANDYHARKVVIHSGYAPSFYYDCWFEEQSILFWKAFLEETRDDIMICIENVLETQPEPLLHILDGVCDGRMRICLDLGHANAYSQRPVEEWLEVLSPHISHFHIHNNGGTYDAHGHLKDGSINMEDILRRAIQLCPEASFTLEIPQASPDVKWLLENDLLE